MALLRHLGLGLLVLATATFSNASDWIFVLPTGSDPITVIRPGDLSFETTIPAPSGLSQVIQTQDAASFYLLSKQVGPGITVLDSDSLEVKEVIALGAGVQDGVATPDGRYVLVSAGSLIVIDAETNEVVTPLNVGSGPTKILVHPNSTFAYVLTGSNAGRTITVVDLDTLTVVDEVSRSQISDIALAEAGSVLVAIRPQELVAFDTQTLEEIGSVSAFTDFDRATIHPVPGGSKVFVKATGSSPDNTSYLVDYSAETSQEVGGTGTFEFTEILIVDGTRAYGVLKEDRELVEMDLTMEGTIDVESLGLGIGALRLGLSPNHRNLFVTTNGAGSIVRIDTATNNITKTTTLSGPPAGHTTLFAPSELPPFSFSVVGGDGQFVPPGVELPQPLTVLVTDELDQPISGKTVLFEEPTELGFTFIGGPEVTTDEQGFATLRVKTPTREQLPTEEGPDIQPVSISASVAEVLPLFFTVNVIRTVGLVKISGDHQIVASKGFFPKELVLLATDDDGNPLPAGTTLAKADNSASCPFAPTVDSAGFLRAICRAGELSPVVTKKEGFVKFSQGAGTSIVTFDFTISLGANNIGIEKNSGDEQTGATGQPLFAPLVYTPLNTGIAGLSDFHTEVSQVSGPLISFSPANIGGNPNIPREVDVTLGSSAGTAVLKVEVPAPNLPSVEFTIFVEGAPAVQITGMNDDQVGKLFTTLDLPLIATVIDQTAQPVPYPPIVWNVLTGEASLSTLITSQGSRATVTLGGLAGPVEIQATLGELSKLFTITSEGPEPDQMSVVSGLGQQLEPGMVSEPVEVVVTEDGRLAAGAIVTFAGAPGLVFQPIGGGDPANPLLVNANLNGQAAAIVELVSISGVTEQGSGPAQTAPSIIATVSSGSVSVQVPFGIIGRTPEFSTSSITNAATFLPGGLVPGGLISIFGHGFMEGVAELVQPGGVTTFAGTTVSVNGVKAPILAMAPGSLEQVNVQVPFELNAGQLVSVQIDNNGTITTVDNVAVFPTQPGIFGVPIGGAQTGAAVLHGDDFSLVTVDNPAEIGEVVILFYTGGGQLEPAVATGELGPSDPLAELKALTVLRVNGIEAELLFTGYAPGFLGLYQTNFTVPNSIGCGVLPITLELSSITGPASLLPVQCP